MKITAYNIYNPLKIVTPNKKRKWMDDSYNAFAYRCLPLTVANGFGWDVLNPSKFSVVWTGGPNINDIKIFGPQNHPVSSHFGSSVITFSLGFLIRTEQKQNLYVKGPANNPKRGIVALEGIVETDWLPFTFTMNWKITEPNYLITFEEGETICSFFPIQRGYIESFEPEIRDINENSPLAHRYYDWANSRSAYNKTLSSNGNKGERDYLRGMYKDGSKFEDHQNIIKGKEFTKATTPVIMDPPEQPCYDNCCMKPEQ